MKTYNWDMGKNKILKKERKISFEDVLYFIENNEILEILEHPNKEKYPNQQMYVIKIDNYVYLVPFVETEKEIFLKTIIPSRKATKKYIDSGY